MTHGTPTRAARDAQARRKSARMRRAQLALAVCACWMAAPVAANDEPAPAEPATPRFAIRISQGGAQRVLADEASGGVALLSTPLRDLIGQAFEVNPRDVRADAPVDLARRFDVVLHPQDPDDRREIRQLMRAGLPRSLGLTIESEQQSGPLNRLRRKQGEPPLEPSMATEPSFDIATGRFGVQGATMRDLVDFLRWRSPRPVIDETELDGRYDFVLEWDPSAGTNAVFLALLDIGLEIVPDEGHYAALVVRPSP